MATALAAQLARIASKSSNPLDLAAQKQAHSQSLLFEPHIAASQDYETIYQICLEGYLELCQLDQRFTIYTRSIFSEQSRREERSQMTAAQNKELDEVLESFLGLVGVRLLLKPALKAVEWLVRRFRVHEYNTHFLVLTFLPYHTMPLFSTLLALLPQNIPPTLKFLHPYIKSFACPPRRAIVHAATHNQSFLNIFNNYILKISRAGQQYSAMISYWASVESEALAGLIDLSKSGRQELQRQKESDILLQILPVLNEGLSMRQVPDVRVACYMIVTVLASKLDLEDNVLTTMMEAVVKNWDFGTTHAGLICTAVLAQQRSKPKLPKAVFKAVMAIKNVEKDLKILNEQYCVHNLAFGLVIGVLDDLHKRQDAHHLVFVRTALEGLLVSSDHIPIAIRSIVAATNRSKDSGKDGTSVQSQIADLLLGLVSSRDIGVIVKNTLRESDVEQLEASLQVVLFPAGELGKDTKTDRMDEAQQSQHDDFHTFVKQLPARTEKEVSFLSRTESHIFHSLANAFRLGSSSGKTTEAFSDLPVLRKSLALTEPLYFSFFVRYWCSPFPDFLRSAAICCVRDYFQKMDVKADMQALIPYLLYALADPAPIVRRAATELLVSLSIPYTEGNGKDELHEHELVWGKDSIYGEGNNRINLSWLCHRDISRFVHEVLIQHLEELRLDESFLSRLLQDCIRGSQYDKNAQKTAKELKKSTRAALFAFLCSHVSNVPLCRVQTRLLPILNGIGKIGTISRSKSLMSLLVAFENEDEATIQEKCEKEHVIQQELMSQVAGTVMPSDSDGVRILHRIIALDDTVPPQSLWRAAFQRIRDIWPLIRHDMQLPLSATLMRMVMEPPVKGPHHDACTESMDTLRTVPLSVEILISILENRPTLSSSLAEEPSHPKRRRTSSGYVQIKDDQFFAEVEHALRYVTVVLELIEVSKNGASPRLLKNLFRVLTDLQHYQTQKGVEMAYLQSLVIGCIHRIIESSMWSPDSPIDRTSIRADLIIDCFRTTTSPQVQQISLLLMSALAQGFPELIIHSIMPIFTFMGTTILRQSDNYSAHIVDQTIDSVIPPLVETLHKQKGGPLVGASELLLSFAAAFEHMPSHRRKSLFSSLINKLGVEDFLFALLVLLMDRYADNGEILEFVTDFMDQYSALVQLKTMNSYLEVAIDALKPKPTISGSLLSSDEERTRASTVLTLLSLPKEIFRTQRLMSKAAKGLSTKTEDAKQLNKVYARLVENTLILAGQVQPYKSLPRACEDLLDALLGLFSLEHTISSLDVLLLQGNESIRRQVLKTLEHRLSIDKSGNAAVQQASTELLSQLVPILESSSDQLLVLGAMTCVDRIIENYGKKDAHRFSHVVEVIASDRCLGADNPRLRIMTIFCLATAAEALGEVMIPVVPKALSSAVKYLSETLQQEHVDEGLHSAVYSFLGALFLYIPWILTGEYLDQILAASHQSANSDLSIKCNESRLDVLDLIAKQTTAPECFAALNRTWNTAMEEGPQAIQEHLRVLRAAIERQTKSTISKQSQSLISLFLKGFDLRRIQRSPRTEDSYEDMEIDAVEHTLNEVAIKMIYKLNDATFRPIFIKLSDWVSTAPDTKSKPWKVHRQITWYTFLHTFFGTLQSIVTSYSSLILTPTIELLTSFPSASENADNVILWNSVFSALHASFTYDQDSFWQSPTHFSLISSPLLSSLSLFPSSQNLVSCITALAAAADSPDHHKTINSALLTHMRANDPLVRLAAVRCEIGLTEKLGEEWLALLAEMLPSISEGQDDEDERVEREVGRWIGLIEGILGESLDGMLT